MRALTSSCTALKTENNEEEMSKLLKPLWLPHVAILGTHQLLLPRLVPLVFHLRLGHLVVQLSVFSRCFRLRVFGRRHGGTEFLLQSLPQPFAFSQQLFQFVSLLAELQQHEEGR